MSLMMSDEHAALLEAGRLSRSLGCRYQQAREELLEPGELAQRLEKRQHAHHQAQTRLDDLARQLELLPRQADDELTDLRRLGDWVLSALDDAVQQKLLNQFIKEERDFLEQLDCAAGDRNLTDPLGELIESTRQFIEATQSNDK